MLVRIVKAPYDGASQNFLHQTPGSTGKWENIQFTEDIVNKCDYLIVLQKPYQDIQVECPEGNAWLITQEPPVSREKYFTRSFKYFDRVFSYYNYPHPNLQPLQPVVPWFVQKSYDELLKIGRVHLDNKEDSLVWITSNKKGYIGQKARMRFKDYLDKISFEYKIFGKGFNLINDKFNVLFPSKYALAIENYSHPDYWTEKLADCFLSWNLPFYWGAHNLEYYFPEDSFIRIDIHDPKEAVTIIQNSIINNEWEKRLSAIQEARNLVLNKYQFFPFISNMIKKAYVKDNKRLKTYVIPANPLPNFIKVKNNIRYYIRRIHRQISSNKA